MLPGSTEELAKSVYANAKIEPSTILIDLLEIPLGRLGRPDEVAETVIWMVKTYVIFLNIGAALHFDMRHDGCYGRSVSVVTHESHHLPLASFCTENADFDTFSGYVTNKVVGVDGGLYVQ